MMNHAVESQWMLIASSHYRKKQYDEAKSSYMELALNYFFFKNAVTSSTTIYGERGTYFFLLG